MKKIVTCLFLLLAGLSVSLSWADDGSVSVRRTARGILLVDTGCHIRALEPFHGLPERAAAYAAAVNRYRDLLPDTVRIYNMVIPTSTAFYCPPSGDAFTGAQLPAVERIYSALHPSVLRVDAFGALSSHIAEPVYLRTDHHWSPLGAYYAAQAFAQTAGTDTFLPLSAYDSCAIHGFVGSMYYFTKQAELRRNPETFVYYRPKNITVSTTYVAYRFDKRRRVTGESEPFEGDFFLTYPEGSSRAYSTFMGGDTRLTTIRTAARSGRRLMIIKDSYGNALPPFLFTTFDTIVVVDFRYYQGDIARRIASDHITDILIVNNLQHAYQANTARRLCAMLPATLRP